MATKIVTGKVRFSYVNVWEPKADQAGQKLKYSMSVLIDKNDKETISKIEAAVNEVLEGKKAEWASKNGKMPAVKKPLRDGDTDKPDHDEYAGMMFLNASSTRQPGIVDKQKQEVIDRTMIYSGCYGRVQLSFFAYDVQGSKGVGVGLENIQTFNEGESFGGHDSAEDAFDDAFSGAGEEPAF